jgi:predicted SprT family Zn-dependent metalloprotease
MELLPIFEAVNVAHFDGFLDPPVLRWNTRLRASAGRFLPGSRKFVIAVPPAIELAAYLLEEGNAAELVRDTLSHEMIHYWLWTRRRPYGHTPEFWEKMTLMGASRWNPVPRTRPFRYLYRCRGCRREVKARKRLGLLACLHCCKEHSRGYFDERFILDFEREINEQSYRPQAGPEGPAGPIPRRG